MKLPDREFNATPGVRTEVPLLVGLMGPSGGGKTYSALRLATGIQRVRGGEIYVVDTEAKRALHYADSFKFQHIPFDAPFGSLDYLAVLRYCVTKKAGVIIVDSQSHEHEGEGGYLAFHEAELDRMAGNDYEKRERVKFAAWIKPAANRRALINGLLQMNAAFIFCFRAKEKIKPQKGGQPLDLGFMPIAGEEFLFEMTINALLMPHADGVPTWKSDKVGENLMMKLPAQFRDLFAKPNQISEEHGVAMAEWAKGSAPRPPASSKEEPVGAASGQPSLEDRAALLKGELKKSATKDAAKRLWDHSRAKAIRAELLKHPDAKVLEELTLSYEARITTLEEAERARPAELEAGK